MIETRLIRPPQTAPAEELEEKLLYLRGNASLLYLPGVAIVGSRKASLKGLDAAADCARQLAEAGVNVVSGYANGVDLASHKAALVAGGVTTLVLAEGIERFYLKKDIVSAWDWNRSLVVSQFPNGTPWSRDQAMQRNGTLCWLVKAVIVAEAQRISGTMNTVRRCLKLGLPLFAVYYDNMDNFAQGNKDAIDLGARPLYKSRLNQRAKMDPILELLGVESRV
jgi:DNA processing protein